MIKRLFDVMVAALALAVSGPGMVFVAFLVRRRLGKPVLFRQTRPGLGEQPFEMLKFRTMRDVRGANGGLLSDEQRLTPFGKLLRSTSIDELPELLNVLKGDMSLVGPRPLLTEYLPLYSEEQRRRHNVRPGVTGWAQINGRNAIPWQKKFELDVWYVDNQSFWLDLKILLLTIWRVMKRDNISQQGVATAEAFDGTN